MARGGAFGAPDRLAGLAAMRTLILSICPSLAAPAGADGHNLVIRGGRVMDPETGTDARLNVGVWGNRVERLSADARDGLRVIDATRRVVAPGCFDLPQHDQTVADRTTYDAPAAPSVGMRYVLFGGTIVVDNGALRSDELSGRAVTSTGGSSR